MAIGLTPKQTAVYSFGALQPEYFLVLATEAVARLGWQIHYISHSGIVAAAASYPAQIIIRMDEGSARITSTSIRSRFFDRGKNARQIAALSNMLGQLQAEVNIEYLTARYYELQPFLPPPDADAFLQEKKVSSQASDLFSLFKPVQGYFITPIILNINLLIFLLMALSGVSIVDPDSNSLIQWGANLRSLVFGGEWWRLLTACFVHIGAVHLFMNMYAFLLIGAQLESRLSKGRFLVAYIATGIAASLTSLLWHDHTVSAGASGAIFGMYGVFLALLTTSLVEKANRKQLLASILFFVVYNLLNGLKPGIDNAAHIGGLLTGLAVGYGFVPHLRRKAARLAPAKPDVQPAVPEQPVDYY